ncbi:hypothetical protein N2152v2_010295 [Parachlorella kessleri]
MLGCPSLQAPGSLLAQLQQRRALEPGRLLQRPSSPRCLGGQRRRFQRSFSRQEPNALAGRAEAAADKGTEPGSAPGAGAPQTGGTPPRTPSATLNSTAAAVAASSSAGAAALSSERQPWLSVAALRKVTAAADVNEATDVLTAELGSSLGNLSEAQCRELIAACLDRGNVRLAQSIFAAMTAAAAGVGPTTLSFDSSGGSSRGAGFWPAATIQTATELVIGLARALCTREAIAVITSVRNRGLSAAEDVHFGYVVDCPGAAKGKPLTVAQPQDGVKLVVDSYTRYEYEVFSGRVTSCTSESLVTNQGGLVSALARRVGLLRKPPSGAVHTMAVETPSGQQRTFRFSTETADVPAKVGDRVSVVCSPQDGFFSRRRLISASPPGTKPGEALSLSNHSTSSSTPLQRPANPGAPAGLPPWLLPAATVLVASDAASSIIDPSLPFLAASAFAATVASGVAANTVLLPRLKQLPERAVEVQAARQRLLQQHTALEARIKELVDGAVEDVRVLARLWQLQNKMAAVGGEGAYDARLDRVAAARSNLEQRLQKRVEMVDAYARVIAMIEIEVEMETQVPEAEVLGIEEQIARLTEIEGLQEEWQVQAQAQDEVERLLRAQPGGI